MRLPGHGDTGPAHEIYTYGENVAGGKRAANRTGWSHIAFVVDDVNAARKPSAKTAGRTSARS